MPIERPLLDLPPAERNPRLRADLQTTTTEFKHLLAASEVAQEEILEFRQRVDRLPPNTPLPPRSLRSIPEERSSYLKLQGRLVALAHRYEPLLDPDDAALATLQVDPVLRARAVLLSFASALTLYDNHLSMRTILEDARLRRLIADPARGYGKQEGEIVEEIRDLNSSRNQKRLRELVQGYDRISDRLADMDDPDIAFLQMVVEANHAYRYAREATLAKRLPTDARLLRERVLDKLDELGKDAVGTVSRIFGNGIGLVEMRKGKLFWNPKVETHLQDTLQPLDLLLEKTPFRLTDKFIPGHYGHAAVWVGTAAELEAIGIFDDPLFQEPAYQAYEAALREGRCVLEALRTGVQLSTLAEFLNVDDLAVLRPQNLTPTQVGESLIRAFRQLGKTYDFNFEVETLDKITCSELPYHVYPGVDWETSEQLGQYTISPDQVAAQAMGENPAFRLVDLYHDGVHVDPADALPLMTRLIREA